jgi:UDP-N-acetylmuramoyl-tripeptide--D-alanyl-D-alanine ligase
MGMNAPDEIRPLSKLVRPQVAVITTIAPAHLELLGSLDNIARAKAEIFEGLEPGGTAVLNGDHPQINLLLELAAAAGVANVVTYGFARGVDWQIIDPQMTADQSEAIVLHGDERHHLVLGAAGRHMLANATAALAVAHIAGVVPEVALRALGGFGAQPGRGQRSRLGPPDQPLLLIDESYNANSASMTAALDVFGAITAKGRKVLVLGDMLELGAETERMHAGLAEAVRASGADRVYLVGEAVEALARVLPEGLVSAHARHVGEAVDVIVGDLAYGDAVMVKGSNGVGLSRVVSEIQKRFG